MLRVSMGLFSFRSSKKDTHAEVDAAPDVDLATYQVGNSRLGNPPEESAVFSAAFRSSHVFESEPMGLEVGSREGVLDYVFLTVENFAGRFLSDGTVLEIGPNTVEEEIRNRFGDPYWVDRSDGETILFYEYDAGTIELQFEFPEAKGLGFVTLSRNGVLSEAEQRESYGVDKPWPP